MKLPNAQNAVVPIEKLRNYCLSEIHPEGQHKARVFKAALGWTADDAEKLQKILLDVAGTHDATLTRKDEYGQRYQIEFGVEGLAGNVIILSSWIVRQDEDFPRFVTCYVL